MMAGWLKTVLAGAVLAFGLGAAQAQQPYPNKPIIAIVPYAPGGNTDVIGRIVLEHMASTLGQPIVVENVGGAGGTTGSTRAARAANDGYTILVGQMGTHGASPALYPNLGYNPVTDFAHISQLTDTPIAIFVRKGLPVKDLAEFIAMLKASPDKLNNGHGGVGATSHISCLYLTSLVGARAPMIPYRGSGPALQDLIAGNHDFMCDQIPHTVPHVRGGSIRALAIAMPARAEVLPDTPTTTEAGLPQFQASGWNAVFAPKDTPAPIVARLAAAVDLALKDASVRKKLEDLGAIIPARTGPQALEQLVASEVAKWTPVLKAANLTLN
jgi:tripartite-type tricarboxylate transporter receptor subunit TctC